MIRIEVDPPGRELLDALDLEVELGPDELDGETFDELDLNEANDWEYSPS